MNKALCFLLFMVPVWGFGYEVVAPCDGHTPADAAVLSAYQAAYTANINGSSAGVVHWPACSHPYILTKDFHFPGFTYNGGWLVSVFDNGLYAPHLYPAPFNAYIGGSGSFLNNVGAFPWGPQATWGQLNTAAGEFVILKGVSNVRFSGLNIVTQSNSANPMKQAVWQTTDDSGHGCINIELDHVTVQGDYIVKPPEANVTVGFGMTMDHVSINGVLDLVNYGNVSFTEGFISGGVWIENSGIASDSDFRFVHVLNESLSGSDFLTMYASGGEITDVVLDQVALADTSGGVYKIKNLSPSGYVNSVTVLNGPKGNTGWGVVDPSSTTARLALECHGYGCETVAQQSKQTLFSGYLFPPRTVAGAPGNVIVCQYMKCAEAVHGVLQ